MSYGCDLMGLPGEWGGLEETPHAWLGQGVMLFGVAGDFRSAREMILQW